MRRSRPRSGLRITIVAMGTMGIAIACTAIVAAASEQDDALREAARRGDVVAVISALEAGADINGGDRYRSTAVYLAARAGHAEVVRLLAERGADVNVAETFYDSRPLDTALQNGHLEVAKLLLSMGGESREGALAMAAQNDDLEMVRAVVESGPVNAGALERLRGRVSDDEMRSLLAKAESRPDPAPPTLSRQQLERMVGHYEGWLSDNSAEAALAGDVLTLRVNQAEALALQAIEHGVGGMVETTFESGDGAVEASFWGRFGSIEGIYLSLGGGPTEMLRRSVAEPVAADRRHTGSMDTEKGESRRTANWPGFRGLNGDGIGDGAETPVRWDTATGENVRWKAKLPGLGNSSPVVWGEHVFVTTAVARDVEQSLRVGNTGSGESLDEEVEHSWRVLAFDKRNGKQLFSTEIAHGIPLTGRHFKATQANATVVTDGERLVVVFPTAGLACLDFEGKVLWHHELGGLNASAFMDPGLAWGYSSSPVLYRGTVILQIDVSSGPVDEGAYLGAWNLETGEPVWRVPRNVAPSFATPTLLRGKAGDELVVNGSTIYGYDPTNGKELWSLGPNSELVIARPVVGDDMVYVSAGYAPVKPIYAIRAGTRGHIDATPGQEHERLAWSHRVGGAYMPTPLLYRGLLYVVHHNGRLVVYDAASGDAYHKSRFSQGGTFTGSPIAVNGKIYMPTEEGQMYVIAAGGDFEELAVNEFDEPLMATPAVSEGVLFVRTPGHLFALGEPDRAQ